MTDELIPDPSPPKDMSKEWTCAVDEDGVIIIKQGKRKYAEFRVRLGVDTKMPPKAAAETGLGRRTSTNVDDRYHRMDFRGGYGEELESPVSFEMLAQSKAEWFADAIPEGWKFPIQELADMLIKQFRTLSKPAKQKPIDTKAEIEAIDRAFGIKE